LLYREYEAANKGHQVLYLEVINELHEKLRTGELVAQGFLYPMEKDSTAVLIPAERWRFLKLNRDFTEASGKDIIYVGIVIAKAKTS
jgi:hypothetical protein